MLKINNIVKAYGPKVKLKGVDLEVDGRICALMGESGSGKTTILRIIAGLDKSFTGDVNVTGRTSISFAEPRLFDNVNVIYNVTCVMEGDKNANEEKAREILKALGLENTEKMYPPELSTGMAARVSIARALAYDADNYLFDEPFKALDDDTRDDVILYLKEKLKGKSAIIVTHDEKAAEMIGDFTVTLKDGVLR